MVENEGLYFICDGGYYYWQELIAPYKHRMHGSKLASWSKNLESVRKDVECTFGILKKRFLFLKNPIELHVPEKIEGAFHTCAALHNWLLDYDGWDDWELRGGLLNEDDVVVEYDPLDKYNKVYSSTSLYYNYSGLH